MSLGPAVQLTARPSNRLFHLVSIHNGRALVPIRRGARAGGADIDTIVVDSLKALDPEWPIREADIGYGVFMSTTP